MKCEIKAKVRLNPTEDLDKVIKALSNIFDYDELEIGDDYVFVSGGKESLWRLKESLEERKIRNTARKILMKGGHDKVIFFKLSKQAAFAGVVNFVEEDLSALGEITVRIETDDRDACIDWIAPYISLD